MVSLRLQALIVFALSFALLMTFFYLGLSRLMLEGFSSLELRATQQNIERVLYALDSGLGSIVDGKIDEAARKKIEQITGARFSLKTSDRIKLPLVKPQLSPLLGGTKIYVQTPDLEAGDNRLINGYAVLPSANPAQARVIEVYLSRTIFQEAERGLFTVRLLLLAGGALLSFITVILVEALVVRRLVRLKSDIFRITHAQNLTLRVEEKGRDELSLVAAAFNRLLRILDDAHRERLAYEKRLQSQQTELVALTQTHTLSGGDLSAAMKAITEVAARTVRADSASVWFLNKEGTQLTCQDLYERSQDRHTAGFLLHTENYQAYALAMKTERIIAAHDCRNDPRTKEFTDVYFVPLNITALLIAPIRVAGEVIGCVSVEHIGLPRTWLEDEQGFVASLGDFILMAIAAQKARLAHEKMLPAPSAKAIIGAPSLTPMSEA
jgi:GAF domain